MRLTQEEIINRVESKFPNAYSFENTVFSNSMYEKIIVECKEHGFFETNVASLLYSKTKKCCFKKGYDIAYSKTWNITNELDFKKFKFLEKSNEAHNNFFNYSEFEYKGNKIKGKILCPDHGEFWQSPNDHMSGHGCSKCGVSKSFNYNVSQVVDREDFPIDLYLVNLKNETEDFNKVGISKEVGKRLNNLKCKSKCDIKTLLILPINLQEAFEIETVLKKNKEFKYKPLTKFPGHTECLLKEKEEDVINIITKVMEERFDRSSLLSDIIKWDYKRNKTKTNEQ